MRAKVVFILSIQLKECVSVCEFAWIRSGIMKKWISCRTNFFFCFPPEIQFSTQRAVPIKSNMHKETWSFSLALAISLCNWSTSIWFICAVGKLTFDVFRNSHEFNSIWLCVFVCVCCLWGESSSHHFEGLFYLLATCHNAHQLCMNLKNPGKYLCAHTHTHTRYTVGMIITIINMHKCLNK